MSEDQSSRIVHFPTDEEIRTAFEAYTLAVGKVAYAWNFLLERLGRLFVVVTDMDRTVAFAVWYSTENDRAQQKMLLAAIVATAAERWTRHPTAKEDLKWLLDRAIELGEDRNNAVHAHCPHTGHHMPAPLRRVTIACRQDGGKEIEEHIVRERS